MCKKFFVCLTLSLLLVTHAFGLNNPSKIIIRVAVIDQLMTRDFSNLAYHNEYLRGINLAAEEVKRQGIIVEYKLFNFSREPLAIFKAVDEVKAWQPDFIIGPRISEKFMLLKDKFPGCLVVSPLASANKLRHLPNNFYSFALPNTEQAKALSTFISQQFPQIKGVHTISAIDCLNCNEMGGLLAKQLEKIKPKVKFIEHTFVSTDLGQMPVQELLAGYEDGFIFFLPDFSDVAIELMHKITTYLHKPNLIFIGSDGWSNHNDWSKTKLDPSSHFQIWYLVSNSLDHDTPEIQRFKQEFKQLYNYSISENIAYTAYTIIHNVLSTLDSAELAKTLDKKAYILQRFMQAKAQDEMRYKFKNFVFYQIVGGRGTPMGLASKEGDSYTYKTLVTANDAVPVKSNSYG